ncbi:O-antigen polymerase [Bacteroides fluxus]|nr:O-antigen polymerase [Bacteroides fluxus]
MIGYFKTKSIFSPEVLVTGTWSLIIILYYILPHNLYSINGRFIECILLWVVFFYISSSVAYAITGSGKLVCEKSQSIYRYETVFAVLATVLIAVDCIRLAFTSDYFFLYLRSLNTGLDENIQSDVSPLWGYFRSAMIVVYLIELMELRAGNKRKVILFFILNLLTCFITMAKSQLFTVIFTSVVILHRKKKISVKQLLTVTAICFALFVVMQLLRSNDVTDFSVLEFLAIYILSGTVAFDHFEPLDMGTGSNVFRFFIALLNRLGLSNISANATILDYTTVGPDSITNVYTLLFPYFMDYGYVGIIVFSIVNGLLCGYFFKKSKNSEPALVLYSMLAFTIVFGFFGEILFANLSTFLQYAIYAYIPYYLKFKGVKR